MEQPVVPNFANFALCRFYLTYPSINYFSSKWNPCQSSVNFIAFSLITIFYCKFPYLISPSFSLHSSSSMNNFTFFNLFPHYSCPVIVPPNPIPPAWQALVKLHEFLFFSWYNFRRNCRFSTSRMHKILLHHPSKSKKSMSTSRERIMTL
jgi:hypothetical protein